jgi:hypothetical protein
MAIEITKWKADDGTIYDTEDEAIRRDQICSIADRLISEHLYDEDDREEVQEVITDVFKFYTITPTYTVTRGLR